MNFIPFASIPHDKTKETSTSFSFCIKSQGDYYSLYPLLRISWVNTLDANQSNNFWGNNNGGWTTAVANFYATGIIADIQILE